MSLKFTPSTHRYFLDRKPCPGVTTLLKGLPKPALTYWAARTVAEYVADNPEAVETLRSAGRGPMVAALKGTPWQQRDEAALRGTEIHALAERVVRGEEVDIPERHVDAVQGYVTWLDEHGLEPILTERPVANRRHWYSGTFDLIARLDGEVWLLDIKTAKGVYGDNALQLAAYAGAEFYRPGDDPDEEEPMPHIDRLGVLHVEDGLTTLHPVRADQRDAAFKDFLHAAWIHRAKDRIDNYFENPYEESA